MVGGHDDLEPLAFSEDDGEGYAGEHGGGEHGGEAAPATPRRRRRWLAVAGVVAALVLGWLAFPGRASLARSEVRRLEGQWLSSQGLDEGRFAVTAKLIAAAAPGDQDRVRAGIASLYREQVGRLQSLRRGLRADLLVDPALSRLRASMDQATALRSTDLENVANWYSATPALPGQPPPDISPATRQAVDTADGLLVAQRRHFRLFSHPRSRTVVYRSANPTLTALDRVADTPTGTRLVVSTETGPVLVEIDANRIVPAALAAIPPGFAAHVLFARGGYLVIGNENNTRSYWAASLDLQGPMRPLGEALEAVPAVDPNGVWLNRADFTAVEVNGQGRVLAGPIQLPPGSVVVAAVDAGLVVESVVNHQSAITVWDPSIHATARIVTTQSTWLLATGPDTVVWVQVARSGGSLTVHLTTVSTGDDRQVRVAPNILPCGDRWSISADGSRLASAWCEFPSTGDVRYTPGIVDLASGRLDLLPVAIPGSAPSTIDWASRDQRLFFTNIIGGDPEVGVITYQLGSASIEHLRLHHASILASAVLPSDAMPVP